MATLSANSRRNSAASASVPNSPRPSLTGNGITNSNLNGIVNGNVAPQSIPSFHMTSVNEEETTTEIHAEEEQTIQTNSIVTNKNRLNICSERSDSGFSECSNSSGAGNVSNAIHVTATNGYASNTNTNTNSHSHSLFDKAYSISEEKSGDVSITVPDNSNLKEVIGKVSVNALKSKLEKMAEAQKEASISRRTSVTEKESISPDAETKTLTKKKSVNDLLIVNEAPKEEIQEMDEKPKILAKTTLVRSASLQHKKSPSIDKEPIMKSDFTYTIKMRKKSLECNALKEKQSPVSRVPLETSGRVSKLMQRFNGETNSNSSEPSSTPSTPSKIIISPFENYQSKSIADFDDDKPDSIKSEDIVEMQSSLANISRTTTFTDMTSITTPSLVPVTTIVRPIFVESSTETMAKTKLSAKNVKTATVSSVKNINDVNHIRKNVSMECQSVFDRLSQNKLTNPNQLSNQQTKAITHSIANNTKINKKQINIDSVDTTYATTGHRTINSPTSVRKTTAYAAFNRTSPVRLSNKVKEVTDRLSTPKAVKKPMVSKTVLAKNTVTSAIAAASAKSMTVERGRATTTKSSTAAITTTTAEAVAVVTETTVTTTSMLATAVTVNESAATRIQQNTVISPVIVKQSVNNSNFTQIDDKQKFSKNKTDGEFTLKSKMNENFKKASAFWKAT